MRWRFDFLHPSTSKLRVWLETGEPVGVGEHVEHCDRCADRLEHLEVDDPVSFSLEPPAPLRQMLSAALSPPEDLSERVLRSVERRGRREEELQLFAGLFSIGFETARLMIDTEVSQDHHGEPSSNGHHEPIERDDLT